MNVRHLPVIFNIIWFEVCWIACVMLGNIAAVIVLSLILFTYLIVPKLRPEIWLLLAIFALGFTVDSVLISTGVLQQSSGGFFPPLWLSVLWLAFATTINHSLKSLMDKKLLFLLLALVGGPLSYKVGVNLTDIQFGLGPWLSLSVLAAVWLVAGYMILMMYFRWKTYAISQA